MDVNYKLCSSCQVGWGSYNSNGRIESCMDKPENCAFFQWEHCGSLYGSGKWIDLYCECSFTLSETRLNGSQWCLGCGRERNLIPTINIRLETILLESNVRKLKEPFEFVPGGGIAENLIDVQPMPGPVGLYFKLEPKKDRWFFTHIREAWAVIKGAWKRLIRDKPTTGYISDY